MPREPVLRNTCRCPRTSLPHRAFYPTDHVQQDIHPTDNPPPSAQKSRAGKTRRRVGQRRGQLTCTNDLLTCPRPTPRPSCAGLPAPCVTRHPDRSTTNTSSSLAHGARRALRATCTAGGMHHSGKILWNRIAARTIPLFHTISARPPKQSSMVRTFLKVHTLPMLEYALRCRGY